MKRWESAHGRGNNTWLIPVPENKNVFGKTTSSDWKVWCMWSSSTVTLGPCRLQISIYSELNKIAVSFRELQRLNREKSSRGLYSIEVLELFWQSCWLFWTGYMDQAGRELRDPPPKVLGVKVWPPHLTWWIYIFFNMNLPVRPGKKDLLVPISLSVQREIWVPGPSQTITP
jgi:hypothetical protein